jgi:hypothetical protein
MALQAAFICEGFRFRSASNFTQTCCMEITQTTFQLFSELGMRSPHPEATGEWHLRAVPHHIYARL